ncbi:MAG: hypothetical protein ABSF83_14450 [Nitrososphaerales archaeon]
MSENLESVGSQIRAYEKQFKDFLDRFDASVEDYKFSVEKKGEEIIIDVGLRARIRPKHRAIAPED